MGHSVMMVNEVAALDSNRVFLWHVIPLLAIDKTIHNASHAAQGDDVDEVAHQPAWLNEDGSAEDHEAANGSAGPAGPVHERGASNGAADFIGLDNGAASTAAATAPTEAPYANGNGHAALAPTAAPGAPAAAAAAPAAAPAADRDPLEDLLSLSPGSQPEPPKPGVLLTSCAP